MPAAWLDPSPRFGGPDSGNDHSQRIREARCPTMPNDPDKRNQAFAPSHKPTHHGPWCRAFPYARREPLRYRKLPTVGYTVLSVGPNRIDDGGSAASPDSKRPLDLVGTILRD